MGGSKSAGLGSKPSSINYKQMVLVPKRQTNARALKVDPEARDPGDMHKSFMQRFKISKKYREVVAAELAQAKLEIQSLAATSAQRSLRQIRTIDPAQYVPFKSFQINFSDLAVFDKFGLNSSSGKIKPPSPPTSAVKATDPSKKKTPAAVAGAKKAASAAPKRSTPSAAARPTIPKPPPLSSKTIKSTGKTNSTTPVASNSNATENDVDVASLLIGLASRPSKGSVLGFSSPTKQLSITQYVSSPAQPKLSSITNSPK
jgi:hypothetical protein